MQKSIKLSFPVELFLPFLIVDQDKVEAFLTLNLLKSATKKKLKSVDTPR